VTQEELRDVVVQALTGVAPEIDPASVRPGVNVRDQLDLDSMDFLNFVLALRDRLGLDIPEVDYPKLMTLDGAVAYRADHVADAARPPSRRKRVNAALIPTGPVRGHTASSGSRAYPRKAVRAVATAGLLRGRSSSNGRSLSALRIRDR
jgi:acyl carrier protein